jgi:hypothetical protein
MDFESFIESNEFPTLPDLSELEEGEEIHLSPSLSIISICEELLNNSFFCQEQRQLIQIEIDGAADDLELLEWAYFLQDYVPAPLYNGKRVKGRSRSSWPNCQFQTALQKDEFYNSKTRTNHGK